MSEKRTGVITQVMLNKGFAFLRDVEDRQSRFIYARDVVPVAAFDTLHEGQQVTYEPVGKLDTSPGAKNNGLRAIKVCCS